MRYVPIVLKYPIDLPTDLGTGFVELEAIKRRHSLFPPGSFKEKLTVIIVTSVDEYKNEIAFVVKMLTLQRCVLTM